MTVLLINYSFNARIVAIIASVSSHVNNYFKIILSLQDY